MKAYLLSSVNILQCQSPKTFYYLNDSLGKELGTIYLLLVYKRREKFLLAVLAEDTVPEQRRVRAWSTVVLPCYAVTPRSSVDSDGTTTRRRRRSAWAARDYHVDDDTDRKLRHSRRAGRQRSGEVGVGGWLYGWRRDDEPIDAAVSSKFSVDPLDHSLTIRNASSAVDTAMYTCLRQRRSHGNAANSSTTDNVITSRQIQLVVEGHPAIYFRIT